MKNGIVNFMYKTDYTSNVMVFVEEENGAGEIKKEYDARRALFGIQPAHVQQFLENQARILAETLIEPKAPVHFNLPEEVISRPGQAAPMPVSEKQREQLVGGILNRIARSEIRAALQQRIAELEQSTSQPIAVGAMLIRHVTAMYLVHKMLPSGRTVRYRTMDGEEIPSLPEENPREAMKEINPSRHPGENRGPESS